MAHPPPPGSFVQPNFLPVVEAMKDVPFPISKRELIEQVGTETCVLDGRNVELHDLIKDIHDDYFDSEDELLAALENHYSRPGDPDAEVEADVGTPLARLPIDAPDVDTHVRLGNASPRALVEPEEDR